MSRSLEFPDPIYDALEQAAAASGTTPLGWIAAHLPPTPGISDPNGAQSLSDLFKGRTGRIASAGDVALSENCGERLIEHLEDKRREGRL
jgi:hypothetical protein